MNSHAKYTVAGIAKIADKQGTFLKKMGGLGLTWEERWFGLVKNQLYYFNSNKEYKGTIDITKCSKFEIKEISGSAGRHDTLLIHGPRKIIYLQPVPSKNIYSAQDWARELEQVRSSKQS